MPAKVNFSILDSSDEVGRVSFYLPEMDNTNYEAISGDNALQSVGDIRLAMNPLILGNHLRRTVTSDIYTDAAVLPAAGAMREVKALFRYRDTVNARVGTFELPTFDVATYGSQGTDILDLTQPDLAAFVTVIESECQSRDGNAIQIVNAEVVGRNV